MENTKLTNDDRMLQIVLSDQRLSDYGGYNPSDYETISDALNSECATVVAVAKFIQGVQRGYSSKEIYTEVQNYLKLNL
jgi:hypothetical protein